MVCMSKKVKDFMSSPMAMSVPKPSRVVVQKPKKKPTTKKK